MSKETKLTILTVVLTVLFPVCMFWLNRVYGAFLVVGIFSGVGALLSGIVLLDMKSGKEPNLVPIGFSMAVFGGIFFCVSDFFPWVSIPLSTVFVLLGGFLFIKGFNAWRKKAPTRGRVAEKDQNTENES